MKTYKNLKLYTIPVGKRTRRDKTAARLPLQGSKAIGLGHS